MAQPLAGHVASLRILVCSHLIVKHRFTPRCLRTAPLVRSHAVCLPTDGGRGWQTGRGAPAWRWLVVRALQVVPEALASAWPWQPSRGPVTIASITRAQFGGRPPRGLSQLVMPRLRQRLARFE